MPESFGEKLKLLIAGVVLGLLPSAYSAYMQQQTQVAAKISERKFSAISEYSLECNKSAAGLAQIGIEIAASVDAVGEAGGHKAPLATLAEEQRKSAPIIMHTSNTIEGLFGHAIEPYPSRDTVRALSRMDEVNRLMEDASVPDEAVDTEFREIVGDLIAASVAVSRVCHANTTALLRELQQ